MRALSAVAELLVFSFTVVCTYACVCVSVCARKTLKKLLNINLCNLVEICGMMTPAP